MRRNKTRKEYVKEKMRGEEKKSFRITYIFRAQREARSEWIVSLKVAGK